MVPLLGYRPWFCLSNLLMMPVQLAVPAHWAGIRAVWGAHHSFAQKSVRGMKLVLHIAPPVAHYTCLPGICQAFQLGDFLFLCPFTGVWYRRFALCAVILDAQPRARVPGIAVARRARVGVGSDDIASRHRHAPFVTRPCANWRSREKQLTRETFRSRLGATMETHRGIVTAVSTERA